MLSPKDNLAELVRRGLYEIADLNSQIPDIDQIIEFFHRELKLPEENLGQFREQVLEVYTEPELLRSCFYPGIIEFFSRFPAELTAKGQSCLIASWTQGNLYLQARKAELFHEQLDLTIQASPSIYASLDKLALLPVIVRDLRSQGCDHLLLIDDRLNNVMAARERLKDDSEGICFIHKIRPDKPPTQRISDRHDDLCELTEWDQLERFLCDRPFKQIGLILDKDGVIYDTTLYRMKLSQVLAILLENIQ